MANDRRVGNLFVQMRAELGQLKLDVTEMRRTFESGFSGIKSAAASLGTSLAAAFSVSALVGFSRQVINLAGQLQDLEDQTGISSQTLSGLKTVLDESGTSLEAFAKGIFTAQRNLGQITNDSSTQAQAVKALGLNLNELRNANPNKFLELIADALGKIDNPTQRAALGAQLLGKSFQQLAPALSQIAGRLDEFKRAGMSSDDIKRLDDFGDSWTRLGNRLQIIAAGPLASLIEGFEQFFNLTERARITNSLIAVGDEIERINKMLATRESLRGKGLGFFTGSDDAQAKENLKQQLDLQRQLDQQLNKLNASGKSGGQSAFVPLPDNEQLNKIKSFLEGLSKQTIDIRVNKEELLRGKDLATELSLQFKNLGGRLTEVDGKFFAVAGDKNSAAFIKIRDSIVLLNDELAKSKLLLEQTFAGDQSDTDFGKAKSDEIDRARQTAIRLREQTDEFMRRQQTSPAITEDITFGLTDEERAQALEHLSDIAKQAAKPLEDLRLKMDQIAAESAVFGTGFDSLSPRIDATRQAIIDLLAQGLDPLDPKIQQLRKQLDQLTNLDEVRTGVLRVFDGIATGIDSTLQGIFQGTQSWGEGMKRLMINIGLSIANELQKIFILDPLKKALSSSLSNIGGGGSSGGGGGFDLAAIIGSAWNGIAGLFTADGGIFTQPTMRIIGEAGPEAVVPLGKLNNLGGGIVIQNLDARGAQRGVSIEIRRAIEQAKEQAIRAAPSAVANERRRSNNFAKIFR